MRFLSAENGPFWSQIRFPYQSIFLLKHVISKKVTFSSCFFFGLLVE